MKKTYTLKEVAKITGQHYKTVYKHLQLGLLNAKSLTFGGTWRVSEENLQDYLNKIA
ncbi:MULTISPECIES: helix-turn-helix domain-containing protein [unclassified Campylobacter]|uniref:helix-turn-helix domain-containing protein n=1 Tax=unclassified Campylobacter TaxID=2593542 RepID=UPI001DBF4E2A|nr:helix-turn-helix domain-containing protein [Campylobacter sp. RM9331]MBZ8005161.1 helix-turn-helix domain-containing protein [Campylobacter sp. RM9332]